jgi:Domain of unknown function (DUF4190)
MASRGDVTEASSTAATVRQSHMALAALALSVFAFIPPLGIAAVVLGHISSRDIAASQGKLNGKAIARAALVIGYVQMFLLTVAAVVIWLVLGLTLQDFRRDALVQRVLRESSANATLDYASAREEENTARALVIQMVAIEDQYYRGHRNYLCSVSELSQVGVEGSTPAEKRAFNERLQASAYIFELRGCDSEKSASLALGYKLTAVPRAPRMPPDSLIYCADETGTVLQTSSATSVDCFDHGYVILKPTTPRIQKAAVEPVVATPVQGPAGTCDPSEKTPCGADMGVVRAAWTSPEALWEFLTLPETDAPERRIAASKAGQIIPLDWLPKVLQARRELRKEQALHNFGLADYPFKDYSPFYSLKTPRDRIGTQTTRMIMGHAFVVPEKWIEYPPTEEGIKRAWPAQVLDAMETLYSSLIQHGDPKEIDSIALKLPCADYETARQIVDLTLDVARIRWFAPPEVFGAWLNIQRGNSDVNRASIGILRRLDSVVKREDETWAMAQVLGLQALETPDTSMTYPSIDAISILHPTPYTFALGAARYLVSSKDSAFNRAYEADGLLRALGEPLLGTPRFYEEKKQGQYEQEISSFAEWLKKNEARLNERANAEKPQIESVRKKTSVATACRR